MRKQIQKFICKLLEEELLTVLAVSFVGLAVLFTQAAGSVTTNLSFTIASPGGNTINVTAPNGGESWTIGGTETITWTSSGSITAVKIELQRSTGGSWEELAASTTNDGSYPWVVTGSATTEATVRISEVGDATVNDTSNAVFSIVAAVTGGGGGFYVEPAPYQPAINEVAPRSFGNYVATELIVRGVNFRDGAIVRLGSRELPTRYVSSTEIRATVPVNFSIGSYTVYLINPDGRQAQYGMPVAVYKLTIAPPSTGGVNEVYAAKWLGQSATKLTLAPGKEVTVWVEFRNVGNVPWTVNGSHPVRLGVTNPQDHISILRDGSWIVNNRPAVMEGINTVDPKIVNPGEIARFTFTLKAPLRAGRYHESFLPVAEYKTWMRGKAAVFSLDVVIKKIAVSSKLPTTGGMTFTPATQMVFTDSFEKFFSQINKVFGGLWQSVRGWLPIR
jgi:hypothetical protein